jgi:AcrR family transcriptional regulator
MTSREPDPPRVGTPRWWQLRSIAERHRRPRVDGLTLDKITAAALDVVDREGIDALTMRRVADELGTTHTSLYRHVASRDELVVELVDHVLGDVRWESAGDGWREGIELLAQNLRRALLAHPGLVQLLGVGQLLGPNALRGRERGVRLFLDAGASEELAVQAYLLVAHFVIGTAMFDTSANARTLEESTEMADLLASLPAEDFPSVVSAADLLSSPDTDAEFEFGLQTLLDGLAARLDGARR